MNPHFFTAPFVACYWLFGWEPERFVGNVKPPRRF